MSLAKKNARNPRRVFNKQLSGWPKSSLLYFKKILNYLCIAKLFEYKKKVTIIFAKIKYFVQHFQVAVIKYKII